MSEVVLSQLNHMMNQFYHHIKINLDEHARLMALPLVCRARALPAYTPLRETEFKVFSQTGEDGIIQFILSHIPIENDVFIEFGVQNYLESNTRFLLTNDNWRGLVIDSSQSNINYISNHMMSIFHELLAVCGFIDKDNINNIIKSSGISGDIGLLSVDIDGNDYWVWDAIDCVSPRVVICEYNSVLGNTHPITIPYDAAFERGKAHFSNLYFGASLPALCHLAKRKGYDFIGSNRIGSNAFFVRSDISHPFRPLTPQEGYVESRFRESRSPQGQLTFLRGAERRELIKDLPVVDVVTGETKPLGAF